jgi:hypothetical protein
VGQSTPKQNRRNIVSIRDQIMKAKDISGELMEIKEWGVKVEIRTMTARQRARVMENAIDPITGKSSISIIYPEIAIACVFDPESGEPVFTNDDKDALLEKSGAVLEKIASKAMTLSGLTEEASASLGKGS